ncbi:MAG TPA: hypothetical protein VHI54_12555 [Actinomycetota bacterium]|nr:hypothetical protein [Actinomycetota bacterium]
MRGGRQIGVPMLLALAVLVGVACESTRTFPERRQTREPARESQAKESRARTEAPKAEPEGPRFDPLKLREWYQMVGLPELDIQRSSKRLVSMIGTRPRLNVEALRSEHGTVALKFTERASPENKWGTVMTPAQRRMFGAFAADETMGEWLIVFTDVMVVGGVDPIPVTGYRWKRADVEAYADCGIPSSGLDTCTRLFYTTPQMVLLPPEGGAPGARGT